jgi:hypothetical protein
VCFSPCSRKYVLLIRDPLADVCHLPLQSLIKLLAPVGL